MLAGIGERLRTDCTPTSDLPSEGPSYQLGRANMPVCGGVVGQLRVVILAAVDALQGVGAEVVRGCRLVNVDDIGGWGCAAVGVVFAVAAYVGGHSEAVGALEGATSVGAAVEIEFLAIIDIGDSDLHHCPGRISRKS